MEVRKRRKRERAHLIETTTPEQFAYGTPVSRKSGFGSTLSPGYNCRNFQKILFHKCQKHGFKMPSVFSWQTSDGYTASVTVQIPGAKKEAIFAVAAATKKLAKISAYAEAVTAFNKACPT